MNSILTVLFSLISSIIINWFPFYVAGKKDIVSIESCKSICRGGQVFSEFIPPKEPECGSFISCKKCDYDTIVKKNDPSSVCFHIFSNDFVSTDLESQLTLFYGKSQLIIPHNSTLSRLSKEDNVLSANKGKKKHGLFTVAVNWKRLKGVDASQCSNGNAEVEWSLFNIGVYRNWDIVAIIETKPEATFPFCFENVEFPLDPTRSTKIGSSVPTNLKRVGYSISNGRPSAIRITKTIAVNQKEMKLDSKKAMEILLKKYLSFKISISGASAKQIFSETFHESKRNISKSKSETTSCSGSDSNEPKRSGSNSSSSLEADFEKTNGDTPVRGGKSLNKNDKLELLKERLVDKLRGKGFTDPLILDSMMSLGFYSCFRVICTKKKPRISQEKSKLEPRIPLTIESAKNIHSKALSQLSNLIPPGHTVPLPIYNSEYWVHDDDQPHIYNQNIVQNSIKHLSLKELDSKSAHKKNNNVYKDIDNEESESRSGFGSESESESYIRSDLLQIMAITNSETLQNDINAKCIVDPGYE